MHRPSWHVSRSNAAQGTKVGRSVAGVYMANQLPTMPLTGREQSVESALCRAAKCEGSWARQPGQDSVGASPRDQSGLKKRMTGGTTHTYSNVCTRTGNPGGAVRVHLHLHEHQGRVGAVLPR